MPLRWGLGGAPSQKTGCAPCSTFQQLFSLFKTSSCSSFNISVTNAYIAKYIWIYFFKWAHICLWSFFSLRYVFLRIPKACWELLPTLLICSSLHINTFKLYFSNIGWMTVLNACNCFLSYIFWWRTPSVGSANRKKLKAECSHMSKHQQGNNTTSILEAFQAWSTDSGRHLHLAVL